MTDRIAGALLLSAYGDAAGLPHEVGGGLDGQVGDPGQEPLPVVDGFRKPEATPWNIWFPAERTAGMRGVVSDDTATKIGLVEPHLRFNPDRWEPPGDAAVIGEGFPLGGFESGGFGGFRVWLEHLVKPENPRPPGPMALAQARDWIAMFAAQEAGTPGRTVFYEPGVPVVFGPFLYQTLALSPASAEASLRQVFDRFAGVCALDEGIAKTVTGVLAALTAAAVDAPHDEVRFGVWLRGMLEHLRGVVRGSPGDEELVGRIDWLLQETSVGAEPDAFLAWMKRELYDHPERGPTRSSGLKPFDSLLQLSQVVACLLFGAGDPVRTMAVATNVPGDADTVPAFLGVVLGAWAGRDALMATPLGEGLAVVEATTAALFGVSTDERAAVYAVA